MQRKEDSVRRRILKPQVVAPLQMVADISFGLVTDALPEQTTHKYPTIRCLGWRRALRRRGMNWKRKVAGDLESFRVDDEVC